MMPVIDGSELIKLVAVAFVLGIAVGIIYDIIRLIRYLIPVPKNILLKIIAKFIPDFLEDVLFFVLLGILNVFMFSAYGGGQVRLIAIISELAAWKIYYYVMNYVINKIRISFLKKKELKRKEMSQ